MHLCRVTQDLKYLHIFRIDCDHRRLMNEKGHKSWTTYLVVPAYIG
jgi:hypothetical protein